MWWKVSFIFRELGILVDMREEILVPYEENNNYIVKYKEYDKTDFSYLSIEIPIGIIGDFPMLTNMYIETSIGIGRLSGCSNNIKMNTTVYA